MTTASYSAKGVDYFAHARPEMLRFIPQGASRLLEVGCGSGDFAGALKAQRSVHLTAIEPFPYAAAQARGRVDELLSMSVEQGVQVLPSSSFDCAVFNDVLEHLVDPWAVLRDVKRLLRPTGVIVASLPNMRHMPILKDLVLKGEWRYQDAGVLDRTHLRFFTRRSMADLFKSSGYRVKQIVGINGIRFPWKFALLNRLAFSALEDARYVQFAVVAEVDSAEGVTAALDR